MAGCNIFSEWKLNPATHYKNTTEMKGKTQRNDGFLSRRTAGIKAPESDKGIPRLMMVA